VLVRLRADAMAYRALKSQWTPLLHASLTFNILAGVAICLLVYFLLKEHREVLQLKKILREDS
jgi:uncharacterized protein (DUF2062 family)